jgi:hypothetical protein
MRPAAGVRLCNLDDHREDLELAVMELQDRFGVPASSIWRYVNNALKAGERDGVRGTVFLFQRWKREQDQAPSGHPSEAFGTAV